MVNTRPVVDWLIDGARSAGTAPSVLSEMCARLTAAGMPLWRVAVFIRTLHPNIMGRRFLWRPGAEVEVLDASHAFARDEGPRFDPEATDLAFVPESLRHLAASLAARSLSTAATCSTSKKTTCGRCVATTSP